MSVSTNLTDGNYALTFKAGVKVTDTTKPNKVQDLANVGVGTFPAIGAQLVDGTGAGKANKIWAGVLTIAASSSTTLTLSSGLVGGAGQAVAFAIIRRILIRFRSPATGQYVVVGGAATHPWAPWLSTTSVTEKVADMLLRVSDTDGWTVGSGSADQLEFANPGGSPITVDVVLVGE